MKQKIVEILEGHFAWWQGIHESKTCVPIDSPKQRAEIAYEALLPHMEPRLPKDVQQFLQEHQQLVEDFVGFDCPIKPNEYWDGDGCPSCQGRGDNTPCNCHTIYRVCQECNGTGDRRKKERRIKNRGYGYLGRESYVHDCCFCHHYKDNRRNKDRRVR